MRWHEHRNKTMAGERLYSAVVQDSWIDALGHVNFLEYQRIADLASDRFWLAAGGPPITAGGSLSYVIVKTHVDYLRELRLGDPVSIDTQLIGYDARRIHLYHALKRREELVSIVQILGLAFDLSRRRASHWPDSMLDAFAARKRSADGERLEDLVDWGLSRSA
jgi:acyl-CoA thioester hydrolase